jgi:hypothetical protein
MSDLVAAIEQAADRWMQAWVSRDKATLEDSLLPWRYIVQPCAVT